MFFIKKILSIINTILLLISLILAYVIVRDKFFNFKPINKFVNSFYSFLNISQNDQEVSCFIKYNQIDINTYTNEDYKVYCPEDSIIINKYDDGVVLKCSNGYYAYVGNIININYSSFDEVKKDEIIGNFIDSFNFYYFKGNLKYEFDEINT